MPDAKTRQLRRLVRYRQQLAKERREIKQHLRGLLNEERVVAVAWREWLLAYEQVGDESRWVVRRQLARLDALDREISLAEERLEQASAADPLTHQLQEHKGVGLVTAATMRAEIGSFARFTSGKQLARYCGVTPCNRSSGRTRADAGVTARRH